MLSPSHAAAPPSSLLRDVWPTSPLGAALRQIVADLRPARIVATAESIASGVTLSVASALRASGATTSFVTIVADAREHEDAVARVREAGLAPYAEILLGGSLPRPAMPVGWGGDVDDGLGRALAEAHGNVDLVIIDGLAELALVEFAHAINGLRGPSIIAVGGGNPGELAAVRAHMQKDPRFQVAGGGRADDAFCIGCFEPTPGAPPVAADPSDAPQLWPAGHFFSPIPSLREVRARESQIWGNGRFDIPGVDLRSEAQMELVRALRPYYRELPFSERKQPRLRYHFDNDAFLHTDAILLYALLRHLRPRRFIEVGSGYSSCVTLDTNELFLGGSMACTFIEPYPSDRFAGLLRPEDARNVRIIPQLVQDVALSEFAALEAGDVLFIDSTHVSKAGSDVNRLFFEVLPALKPGVYVHVHDIFFPFEYPKPWVYEGRTWTEAYLLRAFLQYNRAFEVVLFGHYLLERFRPFFEAEMPLCLRNTGGSIWLRKTE